MINFQRREIVLMIDFQIFLLIFIFLVFVPAKVFVPYNFFEGNGLITRLIAYFSFFLYFDFKKKETLAMRIFKYHLVVPDRMNLVSMLKYEVLGFVDLFLFPFYMILSIFSDKKDRLLLRESYTGVRMVKNEKIKS